MIYTAVVPKLPGGARTDISNNSWQSKLGRSPFIIDVDSLPEELQEEAIELRNDSSAKDAFDGENLEEFWTKFKVIYPNVAQEALKILLQFSSTYLCESGFSTLALLKSKQRNRLTVEGDIICALSTISPDIKALVKESQCHKSH